eukprot:scaffold213_cov245-Pinguiococcus_pyrenoidosus.AAC.27
MNEGALPLLPKRIPALAWLALLAATASAGRTGSFLGCSSHPVSGLRSDAGGITTDRAFLLFHLCKSRAQRDDRVSAIATGFGWPRSSSTSKEIDAGVVGQPLALQASSVAVRVAAVDAQVIPHLLNGLPDKWKVREDFGFPLAKRHPSLDASRFANLPSIPMAHQNPSIRGVGGPSLATGDVPRVADHQLEVVVAVDAGADALVVLEELIQGDDAVALVQVELRQEGFEGVVGRDGPVDHLGMLAGVVDFAEVVDGDQAVAGLVQLGVGHLHQLLAAVAHVTSQSHQELVEADHPIAVPVEEGHDLVELAEVELDAVVLQPVLELRFGQPPVPGIVHHLESASDAADADLGAPSFQDLGADLLHDVARPLRLRVLPEPLLERLEELPERDLRAPWHLQGLRETPDQPFRSELAHLAVTGLERALEVVGHHGGVHHDLGCLQLRQELLERTGRFVEERLDEEDGVLGGILCRRRLRQLFSLLTSSCPPLGTLRLPTAGSRG